MAQTAPQKPPTPVEKEEPDYAFLVNSPYVEEKGEVQVIGAIRFDTRRGHPDQKFSNAFARTEWGLTDRWELDLMTFLDRGRFPGARRFLGRCALSGAQRIARRAHFLQYRTAIAPSHGQDRERRHGTRRLRLDVTAGKDFGNPIFTYYSVNYAATPRRTPCCKR